MTMHYLALLAILPGLTSLFLTLTALALHFPNKAWTPKTSLRLYYLRNQDWDITQGHCLLWQEQKQLHFTGSVESYLETGINCHNIPNVIWGYFRAVTLKIRSPNHQPQHHLGSSWTCKFSGGGAQNCFFQLIKWFNNVWASLLSSCL